MDGVAGTRLGAAIRPFRVLRKTYGVRFFLMCSRPLSSEFRV